jgi:L-rhamnose isomerase / sugar isomerase
MNDAVRAGLRGQRIELPSWAFGNSGTRFKVFAQPGVPRTPEAGTSGTIAVPAGGDAVVVVNGQVAWDRGTSRAYQATAADGYVQIPVPGGRHTVTVTQ